MIIYRVLSREYKLIQLVDLIPNFTGFCQVTECHFQFFLWKHYVQGTMGDHGVETGSHVSIFLSLCFRWL